MTSAVLGGLRPESLVLLLAAFSAFAFARRGAWHERPGFYHRVLAERMVDGPIVVLRSDHDRALGTLYPAVTWGSQVDRAAAAPAAAAGRAKSSRAARSGAVGARGVGAPELDLVDVAADRRPALRVVNVDGSRVVTPASGSSARIATSTTTRSRRWCCWRPACWWAAPPVRGRVRLSRRPP